MVRAVLVAVGVCLAGPAFAVSAVVVPAQGVNPSIPHFAYNGRPTILKAIARGGNGTYFVEWDFEGDGTYDAAFSTTNRYDLSTTYQYPPQAQSTTFDAVVRVTSGGVTDTSIYPVRVFADVPLDPSTANDRQLDIMRAVAVDDALWWLHTQLVRTGDETHPITGAQVTGYVNHPTSASAFYGRAHASSAFLWALGVTGHTVAFPPGSYAGTFPQGKQEENDFRWNTDPYAEDALRLLNEHLLRSSVVSVPAADESNATGVYPEVVLDPIPGTDDGFGIFLGDSSGSTVTNPAAYSLAAVASHRLTGLAAQVGDANQILGKRFEVIVQQMVDALTYSQLDGGCADGAWYYTPNAGTTCGLTEAWETIEAITALWTAETEMGSAGVIVNNRAKIRIANYFIVNAGSPAAGESCARYTSSSTGCDFGATAAHILFAGWLGIDDFAANDTRLAFPGYYSLTRGTLRTSYDRYEAFLANNWLTWQENTDTGWSGGLWELGADGKADFEREDGMGNGWTMFHLANAARAADPVRVSYGTQDWFRQFSIFDIQNQYADGHTKSEWTAAHWDYTSGREWMSTGWTALRLTGDGTTAIPVASASATNATEGTPIVFDARASHVGREGTTFTWSFDDGSSATGTLVTYTYPDNGTFGVTLSAGATSDTIPVTITNALPVAGAGLDLSAPEGTVLLFEGTVTDAGTQDTHTFLWSFGDGATASTLDASHAYADDGSFLATFRATDDDAGTDTDTAAVTITNVAPSITSTAPPAATEGATYSYALAYTDPGTGDTHACSLPVKPAGMMLSGCTAAWTPTYAGLGGATNAAVEMCVTDDDLAKTCESWTITIALTDADADGLPDGWETLHFGNTAQNAAGDPDADGVSNADELAAGQDPNSFDGPGAPLVLKPANGTVANEPVVSLVVLAAHDPNGDPLTYDFELASDETFTALVDSTTGVAETSLSASWTPQTALTEDARYCFRARVDDGASKSPWSVASCFLRSETNGAPAAPSAIVPGDTANTEHPVLARVAAADPEEDAVFYDVELATADDFSAVLASASGLSGNNVVLNVALADGTTYHWRVRAYDASGATSAWSATASFTVVLSSSETSDEEASGCGCTLTAARRPGLAPILLALALIGARRKRLGRSDR